MENKEQTKIIIISIIALACIIGGIALLGIKDQKDFQKVVETEKNPTPDDEKNIDEDEQEDGEISEDPNLETEDNLTTDQDSNKKPTTSTGNSQKPTRPSKPVIPEQPITPDEPTKEFENLVITNNMIKDGIYKVSNNTYNTVTINSDIKENTKIMLENLDIKEGLILLTPEKYQLDIVNSTMPIMLVTDNAIQTYAAMATVLENMNKVLEGATINLNGSAVEEISISSSIEINGTNKVSNIDVFTAEEVVINVPSQKVFINTSGEVVINKTVSEIENIGSTANININAPITTFKNNNSSTIRLSEGNAITNFYNKGKNTVVSGNGVITNAKIDATNTRIYTEVTNKAEVAENIDYLIRQELQTKLVDVKSKTQGSVTFTLSEAVKLSLNDISVICSAGKSISLFNLTTKDNITYTLTTSYYKNKSYGLYITLPNGNIISKDFETDYANPTVTDVVTERISTTEAILKLYGVDEGGYIYYILEDASTRETISASTIKQQGKSERVKVGFNSIAIKDLEEDKTYNLYYVMEGYFNNLSTVKGPFEISSQVKEENPSDYQIIYAKEEISNRFVFKLNRIPEKELTLKDFEIVCPSDSSLTIKDAKFYVSPDLLTYIIVIPDNYGHKDNEYTVKIKLSDTEKIEKDFATHMNPPVITGAVDGVVRTSQETAQFTFNSDEPGEVYYGIYEWNGGIYDYNSTTPFASDVITGKIQSNKQKLNAGSNTINLDLTNINVTKYTRVWALFIDEVGNYRVGFVDHYKIPEKIESAPPETDSTLKITDFKFSSNNFFEIEFNEELLYNITSDDVEISIVGAGYLPNKLLFNIRTMPNKVTIKVENHTLTTGEYELKIIATDMNENQVEFVQKIEVK